MPESGELLTSLERITNGATTLAIVWHAVLLIAVGAVVGGARPSRRGLAWMTVLPLLSVSAVAHWYEGRFNAFVFALLAAVVAFSVPREGDERIRRGPTWAVVLGGAMIAFGWTYPHFLDASRFPVAYLYAAPFGLIPCPTLALLIGVNLVTGAATGIRSSVVLAAVGFFYGLVGLVRLNVEIDALLVAGALGLLTLSLRTATPPARREIEVTHAPNRKIEPSR
ncbi:MAG TPA: hypothetical protein VFZ53_12550 [Polyangiaceae bacterium]